MYPPFESVKYTGVQKSLQGFDIDLGNALGKELGLKLEWTDAAWDTVMPSLAYEKADLIISGMTITESRKRNRAFTRPYFLSGQVIARRRGDNRIASLADLRRPGRRVAVQAGTTGETFTKGAKVPVEQIKRYDTLPAALLDVRNGRADAVVADFPALRGLIARDSQELEIVSGEMLVRENVGIAARKDDLQLVHALNEAFGRILDNGTYAKIYKRWMGETPSPALIAGLKKVKSAGTPIPRSIRNTVSQ
jgi:ABC-type amino acid transport substrate-binding protein